MCSISGMWGLSDKALLQRMMKVQGHRGPDDSGMWFDHNIAFGHGRLSILDTSSRGRQPMERGAVITYNGEVYNFLHLRSVLEQKGYLFNTNTDTEVILHAFSEWGAQSFAMLEGMFAFALWDGSQLYLVRDRMGIKPLYYYWRNDILLFSSEMKALLEYEEIPLTMHRQAIHSILSFRSNYLSQSVIENITKVIPGTYLVFSKGSPSQSVTYWRDQPHIGAAKDPKELLGLLQESVVAHTVSDVPIGVYLSGGLDSSSITALLHASRMFSDGEIHTYSVGFSDEKYSEVARARMVAEQYCTNHKEFIVNSMDFRILPKIVWHADEPLSDPTCIPTYLMAQKIKPHATVVLTGDGSDEIFGGYEQYKFMNLYQKTPRVARNLIAKSIGFVPTIFLNSGFPYTKSFGVQGVKRFRNFIKAPTTAEAYEQLVSVCSPKERDEILGPDATVSKSIRHDLTDNPSMNTVMWADRQRLLTENMLMKTDKMSMAWGVESRVPFLHTKVVEFANQTQFSQKVRTGGDKLILRQSMKGILPDICRLQPKTRFFVPIQDWYGEDLKSYTSDILTPYRCKQMGISHDYVRKAFSGLTDSPLYYSRQLWALLSCGLWHRQFIEHET